jgi:glyoxylase-like metal-dependent hydrolase (beta-lactamase superfamily II)
MTGLIAAVRVLPMLVADKWFERRDLGDGISLIWEPHVHEFFRCNIWLVTGSERDLLIDSGMGLRHLRPVLAIESGKPVIAVATHAHVDHIGSLHEFDDRRAHVAEAAAYASMPDDVTLAPLFRQSSEPVTALPTAGWMPEDFRLAPAPINSPLEGGEVIDLGDRQFILLHLPGHSPGCVGLIDTVRGVLFTGDALYDGPLIDDFPHSDVGSYMHTMEQLRALDIRIGHGGHGPSFDHARKDQLVEDYLAGKRRQGCPTEVRS